jgi:hypothetical protein
MARTSEPTTTEPITRDDLQRGFAGIQRGFQRQLDDKRSSIVTVAAGVGVVVLAVVFLLGRRSGKRKTTFVEIRRV